MESLRKSDSRNAIPLLKIVKRKIAANKRRKRNKTCDDSMSSSDDCSCNAVVLARSCNKPRTGWGSYSELSDKWKKLHLVRPGNEGNKRRY